MCSTAKRANVYYETDRLRKLGPVKPTCFAYVSTEIYDHNLIIIPYNLEKINVLNSREKSEPKFTSTCQAFAGANPNAF